MPSLSDGSYGLETLIHEIGHALGLKHPGNYNSTGDYGAPQPHLPGLGQPGSFTAMSHSTIPIPRSITVRRIAGYRRRAIPV